MKKESKTPTRTLSKEMMRFSKIFAPSITWRGVPKDLRSIISRLIFLKLIKKIVKENETLTNNTSKRNILFQFSNIFIISFDTSSISAPFKNFKLLLDKYDLRKKWYDYREREVKNELINWLVESDIKLIGQEEKMAKKFEIKELSSEDMDKLDDEMKSFLPRFCTNCDHRGNFNKRLFSINFEPENKLDSRSL